MDRQSFILVGILLLEAIIGCAVADLVEDKQALLDFLQTIPHAHTPNWNKDSSVCQSWTGVACSADSSRVISLRLPGVGFRGPIPPNTLGRLSAIQILSLRLNNFSGPFPSDFSNLRNLTALYFQFNSFSGLLPQDFSAWKNLAIIDLSNNGFSGSIPSSMSNLTHLSALNLANNLLSGEIPDLNIPSLQELNLANNHLTGMVPPSLQRFPSWVFAGNNLSPEITPPSISPVEPPNPQPTKKSSKLSESALLGIIIGGCVLGFVLSALLIILCYSNPDKNKETSSKKPQKKEGSLKKKGAAAESQEKDNKIVFSEGCNYAFDLEDLLRASAEVLGKGMFGTTYKAALEDSTTVVVKRLKDINVARREFDQQMQTVGQMRHENIAPLRGYYCSKDEKLLIYDYYSQGSVSSVLHGGGGEKRILSWDIRMQIAIGTARGLAYIHTQNNGKFIHGNLKASNVFFNEQRYGCISDIGLATIINPIPPTSARAAGYRAPEVIDTRKAFQASDVYSFGVLLFELLTGKSPLHTTNGNESIHLVRWVQSVVREEWTAEVFDVQLLRYPNIEEEMVDMLKVGMACVDKTPEKRPKMPEVIKLLEDIRRGSSANRPSSEIRSEGSSSPAATAAAAEMGQSSMLQQTQIAFSSAMQSQADSAASQSQAEPPAAAPQ
ncbi:hypothetical protein BT93_A2172 [Corymbia citriodora subsp. variegata]|nr:hypothetical protein BT93_A2172 [Corymbia citriodora subsp. variegata]